MARTRHRSKKSRRGEAMGRWEGEVRGGSRESGVWIVVNKIAWIFSDGVNWSPPRNRNKKVTRICRYKCRSLWKIELSKSRVDYSPFPPPVHFCPARRFRNGGWSIKTPSRARKSPRPSIFFSLFLLFFLASSLSLSLPFFLALTRAFRINMVIRVRSR